MRSGEDEGGRRRRGEPFQEDDDGKIVTWRLSNESRPARIPVFVHNDATRTNKEKWWLSPPPDISPPKLNLLSKLSAQSQSKVISFLRIREVLQLKRVSKRWFREVASWIRYRPYPFILAGREYVAGFVRPAEGKISVLYRHVCKLHPQPGVSGKAVRPAGYERLAGFHTFFMRVLEKMVDGTACDLLLVGSQNNAVVAHVLGSEKDRFFTTLKSPDTSMSQKILSSIVIHRVPLSYRTSSEEAVRDLIALTMAGSVKELQVQSDDPFAALRPFPGLVFEDRRMDLEARYDATDERLNARNLDRVKKIEDKIELILNVLHGTTKTTTRTTSESCVQTSLDVKLANAQSPMRFYYTTTMIKPDSKGAAAASLGTSSSSSSSTTTTTTSTSSKSPSWKWPFVATPFPDFKTANNNSKKEKKGEDEKTQAYYTIQVTEEREKLQDKGDKLSESSTIKTAEKDNRMPAKSLLKTNKRNDKYKSMLYKADAISAEYDLKVAAATTAKAPFDPPPSACEMLKSLARVQTRFRKSPSWTIGRENGVPLTMKPHEYAYYQDNRFRKGWHKRPGIYIVDCDRRWAKHLEITGGVPLLSDPPPSRWSSAPPFSAWRPSWLPLNALKHCDLRAKEIKEQKQRVGANTFREVTEYAWILFGNQGTGSTSHFEPHKTAVWVKLLAGAKRWLILPPSKVQRKCGQQSDNDCSVNDSENKSRSMPRNLEKEMLGKSAMEVIQWAEEQKVPLIDFVQRPGDIVFIPAECMHAVLNLEDSLAYAENFIIPTETAVGTTTMTAESSSSESVPAEVATSSDNPCERERGSVRGLRSSLLEETKRKKREKRERDATRRCLWATAATRRFLQSLPAKDQGMFQTLKNMFVSGYG